MRTKTIAIALLFVGLASWAIGYLRSSGTHRASVYDRTESALREPSLLRRSLRLASL